MRGNLPGNEVNKGRTANGHDESELLLSREYTCPVCETKFKSCSPKMTKLVKESDDLDLRPKYKNLDVVKYQVVECPVCGFADLEKDFSKALSAEIKAYKANGLKNDKTGPDAFDEGVRNYAEAYRHYRSTIRCGMICGCPKGKRGYIAMLAAWLLRGWRQEQELLGNTVKDTDPMSEAEEMKLIKYAVKNYEEAMTKETFPIYGIPESTFDYMLAALLYELGDTEGSAKHVIHALHSKELKPVYRIKAEDLRDKLRK